MENCLLTSYEEVESSYRPSDDTEVIEIPLLLAGWQASALERAAHGRGLTAAEMVRSLLRDFFNKHPRSKEHSKN